MWERLIKLYPRFIVRYKDNYKPYFKLALERGYSVLEKDLQINPYLAQNDDVMREAIKKDVNLIKYYQGSNKDLIEEAIKNGYVPTMKDLEQNHNLGISYVLLNYLIEKGEYQAIKYAKTMEYGLLIDEAFEKYKPTYKDLQDNPFLGVFFQIINNIVRTENVEAIRYYNPENYYFSSNGKGLIEYALKNGYKPTIEEVKYNKTLNRSSEIFKILINEDKNNILYYQGVDETIFLQALSLGYEPKEEDIFKNFHLKFSDNIMRILINKKPSLIVEYLGENDEIYELAYNLGFREENYLEYLDDYAKKQGLDLKHLTSDSKFYMDSINFLQNKYVMLKLLKLNSALIELYSNGDLDVIKYALELGYKPSKSFLLEYNHNIEVYNLILSYYPEAIKEYRGSYDIFSTNFDKVPEVTAVLHGYVPNEEEMENYNEIIQNIVVEKLIDKKPEYIKFYNGLKTEVYLKAIETGYLPNEDVIKNKKELSSNDKLMCELIKKEKKYFDYYTGRNRLYLKIIALDYIPTYDEVSNDLVVQSDYDIMKHLIDIDVNFVNYINMINKKENISLLEYAFTKPNFKVSEELLKKEFVRYSDAVMRKFIEMDATNILYYRGDNKDIFELALSNQNILPKILKRNERDKSNMDMHTSIFNSYFTLGDINIFILNYICTKKFDLKIKNIVSNSYDLARIYKIALDYGYIPKIDEIDKYNIDVIDSQLFEKIIKESNMDECISLLSRIKKTDYIERVFVLKNIELPLKYYDLLFYYNNNLVDFIKNYEIFSKFLNDFSINEDVFIQYAFSINYDWLKDIVGIINKNELNNFLLVKEYFFKNYYDVNSPADTIKSFVNIIKNYSRYKELCLSIVSSPNLTDEQKRQIKYLFENNDEFTNNKPKSLSELNYIEDLFIKKYAKELGEIENKTIEEIKNILCQLLFNDNLENIMMLLDIYGNTRDLKQLQFNNKNNKEISDGISNMIVLTSMMEAIVDANDKDSLIEVAKKILENYKLSSKCMMIFSDYNELMRSLYAKELKINLTRLNEKGLEQLKDERLSRQYGVDIIDLSKYEYCILFHVKSNNETVEEIVNGYGTGDKNFISLSAGSHRNIAPYTLADVIFGYDDIELSSFIQSSVSNMGSNSAILSNSFEVTNITSRRQRGILKTSGTTRSNSEILAFRNGLKPRYVILPNDRAFNKRSIEIAKEYGFKVILVQGINQTISSPKKIDEDFLIKDATSARKSSIDELKQLRSIITTKKKTPRKIAIFSDSHALFEPTLAILEDARRDGITEIYSLGDNIGTGPNPREVLELLEEYNVKSLKGNHELYVTLGVDEFREHFNRTGGYETAKKNSTWTREQLTREQLDRIKSLDEDMVISVGGKKILLSHYLKDYNSNNMKNIPDDVSEVIQGHVHFENMDSDGPKTVRGAGIGYKDNIKTAYYIVLTERETGGFDIEKRRIEYDFDDLKHDINESSLNEDDKKKIGGWI